jgi:hypothetical protein
MTRRQETISIWSGIGLLVIALVLMGIAAVPSDAAPGAENQLARLRLCLTGLAFLLGSAAMALFIAARNSALGVPFRSAGQSALLGLALIIVPIGTVALLIVAIRTTALVWLAVLMPFVVCLGGGYLVLALRSLVSRKRQK